MVKSRIITEKFGKIPKNKAKIPEKAVGKQQNA